MSNLILQGLHSAANRKVKNTMHNTNHICLALYWEKAIMSTSCDSFLFAAAVKSQTIWDGPGQNLTPIILHEQEQK